MSFSVIFKFLTAVNVKNTAFWDVTLRSLVEIYSLSEKLIASIFVALFHAENSNSKFLRNVGKFKQTTRRHIPADNVLKLLSFLNIIFVQPEFQIRLSG